MTDRLYSYVVARDYGFAPNPFHGYCTLATCKPLIRKGADIGDLIVGLTSAKDSKVPKLIYVMRISETLTFNEYWNDERFADKKPNRTSSVQRMMGDNIYLKSGGRWHQSDSHHSFKDGTVNVANVTNDTQTDRVLIATDFAYWGSNAVSIPRRFTKPEGESILVNRGHRSQFSSRFVDDFSEWFAAIPDRGFMGPPFQWQRPRATWARYPGHL
jgi:hypothetical protein